MIVNKEFLGYHYDNKFIKLGILNEKSNHNYLLRKDPPKNSQQADNQEEKEETLNYENMNPSTKGLIPIKLDYTLQNDNLTIKNAESIQFNYGNAIITVSLDKFVLDQKDTFNMKWDVSPFQYRLIDRYPIKYEDETLKIKDLDNTYIDVDRDGLFDIRMQITHYISLIMISLN